MKRKRKLSNKQKRARAVIVAVILVIAVVIAVIIGSSKDKDNDIDVPSSSSDDEGEKIVVHINPLTGEKDFPADAVNKRPISFMVNNIKIATPQSGIADADICYEVPVEGGITRIMAIYANAKDVVKIGSIRSARHYYLDLAAAHNTVFVHYGKSVIAKKVINDRSLDTIDGGSVPDGFVQDEALAREKGREHSFFVTQDSLQAALDAKSTKMQSEITPAFNFADENTATGKDAVRIDVGFSKYTQSYFIYDSELKKYKKSQYDAPHIDANTGDQVAVDNVFVLFTPIEIIKKYKNGLVEVGLESGKGYYASQGKIQEITWEKGNYGDPIIYSDASGSPLKVNTGKSWISIVANNRQEFVTYQGE